MKYEEITLTNFFREKELHDEKLSKIEITEKMADLKNEIGKKDPLLNWEKLYGEIMGTASKLLETKLSDILESAWGKYQEVVKYLDEEKYSSDEIFLIPLVEHTVVSKHHPKIEVRVGEVHVGDIVFEVVVTLFLSGIILKISHGKIQGVKAGKCKSKGSLSCEGVMLLEDESSEFVF